MASFLNSRLRHRSCERRFCPSAPPPSRGNTASASTSSLTGAFYAAPQCAAFPTFSRPRAAPTRSPLPPPLHRVILDANAADTNDRRITCYACNNVCRPWEIWKENRRKEEEEEARKGEGEKTRRAKEERLPKPKPKPANLYLHFALPAVPLVSFTNFTFTATAMATRFASRPLHDRPRCFFSPLPSFSPRRPSQPLDSADREKINQLGPAEEKHALFQFSNLHAFLCKHFQGGSRRRKRSLLASNTNTLTMNHRDHRIRPLLPVRG